jgi:hypothetical protein
MQQRILGVIEDYVPDEHADVLTFMSLLLDIRCFHNIDLVTEDHIAMAEVTWQKFDKVLLVSLFVFVET